MMNTGKGRAHKRDAKKQSDNIGGKEGKSPLTEVKLVRGNPGETNTQQL